MAFPDGWIYRKKISIQTDNLDASQTGFPLCVQVTSDTDLGGRCLATGYDIRFTDSAGTEIPHERESWAVASGAATGVFWVKCNPSTDGTDLYVYYGNPAATDGSDAENVWDDNFVAVYHMGDGANTSGVYDSTQYNNDGTKKGAAEPAVTTSGKLGNAQDFDDTDDYIDCTNGAELDLTDNLTVTAWVKPEATANAGAIVAKDNAGIGDGWWFYVNGTALAVEARYGASWDATGWAAQVTAGEWSYVGFSYNKANTILYNAGAEITREAHTSSIASNAYSVLIGADERKNADIFNGIIDEVRISNIARSAAWLKFEYYNMASSDNELTWGPEEQLIRVRRPHGRLNRPRR